ncbi:MAG: NAD(P)-dependent oxidoreductase [Burkholderiales bacterium]
MKVGFIGLGTMGGPMALNVRAAGHTLAVYDLRRSAAEPLLRAGATLADGPREVGVASDVVFTSLPRPRDVEAVADELLPGMRPGAVWVDLSTNSPSVVRRLQQRCAGSGIDMLDAPVSGGPRGARSRQLALWVGGDRTVFERCRPVLDAIGDEVMYIGPIGTGLVAKLVNNLAHYTIQTALAEIFTLGVKAGVEPLVLWSALRQGSSGRMRTFDRLGRHFLRGVFDPPDFALNLAHKDVALATELARELGVPVRVGDLAYAELTEALQRGWGGQDSRIAMMLQEERAGVRIEEAAEAIQAVLDQESLT